MNNNTTPHPKDLKSPERFSYLLHVWRTNEQWRASLEAPGTGKRIGFANIEQLFAYLMDLIDGTADRPAGPAKDGLVDPQKGREELEKHTDQLL
jgi:hypothetical protein